METEGTMSGAGSPSVQLLAKLVAAAFVLVGIIGFIPGLTTDLYDGLKFSGEDSTAEILGIFGTSILHNIVHLLFGIVGLWMARSWSGARTYLIGGGIIYVALWLLGLLGGLDWIPANDADDWLHFVLGVAMIGLGVVTTRGAAGRPAT
jgi:Domain of unknown function (DUF4383)